jgi:hypothetical protein
MAATRVLLPFPETAFPSEAKSWFGAVFLIVVFVVALQTGRPPAGAQAPSVKTSRNHNAGNSIVAAFIAILFWKDLPPFP